MRTASAAMVSLLASRQFFIADLYTFTLVDGTVLKYTSFDQDIGAFSSALNWERTQWKLSTGLTVDTMDVTLHATPIQTVAGLPIIEHIAAGYWDGATCTIERAIMPTPGDLSAGTIPIMSNGWIGDITEIGRLHCTMQIQSKLALLNVAMPKGLYQPSCRWVFGSPSCGVNRTSLVQIGTVGAGSTATTIQTGIAQPGPIAAPTSAAVLSQTSTPVQSVPPNVTWYVKVTYVNTIGETTASPESSLMIPGIPVGFAGFFASGVLQVASPPSATNVTGWNVYVGVTSGSEQLQNFTAIPIGTGWTMPNSGFSSSGIAPPFSSSNGFFSLGTITLTSGAAAGTTRVVEGNTSGGAAALRVPFFSAIAVGDTFAITPGCPHTMAACRNQFNNIANFGGFPFIPQPEIGAA